MAEVNNENSVDTASIRSYKIGDTIVTCNTTNEDGNSYKHHDRNRKENADSNRTNDPYMVYSGKNNDAELANLDNFTMVVSNNKNSTNNIKKQKGAAKGCTKSTSKAHLVNEGDHHNKFSTLLDYSNSETTTIQNDISSTNKRIGNLNVSNNEHNYSNISTTIENENVNRAGVNPRINFCPPITINGISIDSIKSYIKNLNSEVKFKFVSLGYRKFKLFISDMGVHKKILEHLRNNNMRAFSFCPKQLRKPSVVIKGIDPETNTVELKRDLEEQLRNSKISKVYRLETARSKERGIPLGIFVVKLEAGDNINEICKIKYILNQSIFWEKFKKKTVALDVS